MSELTWKYEKSIVRIYKNKEFIRGYCEMYKTCFLFFSYMNKMDNLEKLYNTMEKLDFDNALYIHNSIVTNYKVSIRLGVIKVERLENETISS